jgi:C1A family cysteine protease
LKLLFHQRILDRAVTKQGLFPGDDDMSEMVLKMTGHDYCGRFDLKAVLITLCMFCLLFQGSLPVALAADPLPQLSPVAPRFLDAQNAPQRLQSGAGRPADLPADGERSTGYLPSPRDYSHLRGKASLIQAQSATMQRVYAPLQYDLRALGRVTPVRDQGSCGACWSFGTLASLESVLLPAESDDFSENNLKNTSGFDWPHCSGGNADMAVAYLSRWSGPVAETDDPYSESSSVSPGGLTVRKHVQEVLIIPGRESALDLDGLKQAIMDHGGITTSIYVDNGARTSSNSAYYKPANSAYYYYGASVSNHIVTIVGWDDTYSALNFASQPPGNGAFIVKNSWGADWGDDGYFYISYYDAVIGDNNYLFKSAAAPSVYSQVYQYDPLGQTSALGYQNTTVAWFANIFSATETEELAAVALHTMDINAAYELYIYTGVSPGAPRSGVLAASLSGTIPYPGYHTVTLPTPVGVASGTRFAVVAKVTNPTYEYPIPLESPVDGYASLASASAGQSYMSPSGSSWQDVTTFSANSNVALKAFTMIPAPVVAGECGTNNGGVFAAAPATDLCIPAAAVPLTPTASGWNWTCSGSGGGLPAACSASRSYTITAAAAANGSISPAGVTVLTHGSSQTYTISPAPGYVVAALVMDGTLLPGATSYTFNSVSADHYLNAYFAAAPPVTILSASGGNGTISPAGATAVTPGSNQSYTITPAPGYVVAALVVDGTLLSGAATYTFTNVTAGHYINVYFEPIPPFTVTAGSAGNGSIFPSGATAVSPGSNQTFYFTPDPGFAVMVLVVDGTLLPAATSYTFTGVSADHYLNAYFGLPITAGAAANGSISAPGTTVVPPASSQTYTITPNPGFVVAALVVDGTVLPGATTYTFTNVTSGHYINAYFDAAAPFKITAGAAANGSISPAGETAVTAGNSQTFTITPVPGFSVAALVVDGTLLPGATSYTFNNVTDNHYINAYFQ